MRRPDSSIPSCFGAPNYFRGSPAFSSVSEEFRKSGCSFGCRLRRGGRTGGPSPNPGSIARPANRQTSESSKVEVVSNIAAVVVVAVVAAVVAAAVVVVAVVVVAVEVESMRRKLANRTTSSVSSSARCSPSRWPLASVSGWTARTSTPASASRAKI